MGLSRAQLVPSCEYENDNIHYKYKAFKSTTDTTNAIDEVVVTGLYKTFKSTTRTELPPHLSLLFYHIVIMMKDMVRITT